MSTPTHHRADSRRRDAKPPRTGTDEKVVLLGFLDYLRDAIAAKVGGVPEPQIRAPGVASGTNLIGLIKHLTHVERFWFLGEDVADWEQTLHPAPDESADELLGAYRDAVVQANQTIDACTDLTLPAPRPPRRGPAPSMRWVLTHMIEETGRHAGHADILREQIDGATGR